MKGGQRETEEKRKSVNGKNEGRRNAESSLDHKTPDSKVSILRVIIAQEPRQSSPYRVNKKRMVKKCGN